jgi:glycosyltransferase involved in cell wall biosynthesis
MPLVSIGMPVRNGERFVREAIESVLAQDFSDFELIISDNASTDATPEIAAAYARADPRVAYHRLETNLGAAANYNRVFHMARGRYFKWAPHDDTIAPGFLTACLRGFEACDPPPVIVYPGFEFIDEDGRPFPDELFILDMDSASPFAAVRTFRVLRALGLVTSILGLMRRDAAARTRLIGAFPASDFAFLFEMAMLGRILKLEDVLYFRRMHAMTSRQANRSKAEVVRWFDPASRASWLPESHRLYLECLRSAARLEGPSLIERATCMGSVLARFAVVDPRITLGRWRRALLAKAA